MIRNLYWEISQIRWIRNRNRRILGDRLERTRLPSISKDQKEMIRSIWGDVHVNMKWIVYYNMFREKGMAWTPYYVPANLHYGVVDMFYSNYDRCRVIEDKNLNSMLYGDVKQPDTILRSVKNGNSGGLLLMDRYYNILDERQALHILSTTETLICKPAILSGGGRNIIFMDTNMSPQKRLDTIRTMPDVVVQQIVKQHTSLSVFNPDSLNTMRLVTFITQGGDVRLLSSVVRMGVGKNRLDNASSGGIFVGLDECGYMRNTAHNLKGESFHEHPSSGISFHGHMISGFEKCKDIAVNLAPRFYGQSRLISWDMTLTADNEPLLIEANMNLGGIDIPQIANGPLFGDYTEKMIKEVFSVNKNRFRARFV